MQCAAVTLCTSTIEDSLALLFEFIKYRIWIVEWRRVGEDCISERSDSRRTEQRLLERCEIIKHVLRWFHRDLCVGDECASRLFLERAETTVMLVATLPVWSIGILAHDC